MNEAFMNLCKRDLEIIERALRDPEVAKRIDAYLSAPVEYVFNPRSK
jgi:hypothetical protein